MGKVFVFFLFVLKKLLIVFFFFEIFVAVSRFDSWATPLYEQDQLIRIHRIAVIAHAKSVLQKLGISKSKLSSSCLKAFEVISTR